MRCTWRQLLVVTVHYTAAAYLKFSSPFPNQFPYKILFYTSVVKLSYELIDCSSVGVPKYSCSATRRFQSKALCSLVDPRNPLRSSFTVSNRIPSVGKRHLEKFDNHENELGKPWQRSNTKKKTWPQVAVQPLVMTWSVEIDRSD